MRISDWSSDVCSSDLAAGRLRTGRPAFPLALHDAVPGRERASRARRFGRSAGGGAGDHGPAARQEAVDAAAAFGRRAGAEDRKSVVWGESVSVRVDLGGRRIIKKKTQNLETTSVSHPT